MGILQYVESNTLPVTEVEYRRASDRNSVLALASHAPSYGINYAPIDDLIISFVLISKHSAVVRDLGNGRQEFTELPGCILVTPPQMPSYWYFEGTPLVLHFNVPQHEVRKFFLDYPSINPEDVLDRLARKPHYDPLLSQLAFRIWAALESDTDASRIFVNHAFSTMLSALCLQNDQSDAATTRSMTSAALPAWRLKQVMTLISDHLDENISVDEMADSISLSKRHFLRAFSATVGKTPHQWVTELRIEKAKALLRDTSMPTTEISLDLGFSSPAHFSNRFRQITGMSPTEWRQSIKSSSAV